MTVQNGKVTFNFEGSTFTSIQKLSVEDQSKLIHRLTKWRAKVEKIACEHYLSTNYSQYELGIVCNDE